MIADCGFLDNIAYDYEKGNLTPEYEVKQMCDTLTFMEQTKLIKHYNLAKAAGAGSKEHFKLVTVVYEIIKDNMTNYVKNTICPSPLTSSKKYINWKC